MFIFLEYDSISKAEISELIETKTKIMEAKYLSEIKLIKGKLIELIKSNIGSSKIGSGKIGSDKLIDCPVDNPLFKTLFKIVDETCLR